jgi:hypothetical protein
MQKIENKIKGSLKNCQIKDNWPQYESFSIHVDSLGEEVLKHKKEWLERWDVYSIFYDLVSEAITAHRTEDTPNLEGNLWDILGEEKGLELTENIKNYFFSIPRTFDIYIPLPRLSDSPPTNIQLSDNIYITSFKDPNEIPGGYQEGLLGLFGAKLELNKPYLRQRITGYCGNRLENSSNKKAINNFKILLQQGLTRDIFKANQESLAKLGLLGGLKHHQIPKAHVTHIDQQRTPLKLVQLELPLDFCQWLNNLTFNFEDEPLNHIIDNPEKILPVIFRKPIDLIECQKDESRRILSAIQWCLDSYIVENQTLAFLQVCIGLEALFGDDTYNGGLTEMLADRCAYLVSNDIKGRKSIKKDFKELYDARSKIVHGNATELDSNDKWHLNWGRRILEYAIMKEIKHLNLGKP